MRRALLACAAAALLAAPVAAAQPTLRLVVQKPLTIRGAGFERSELVRVVVVRDGVPAARRTLRAGTNGTFTLTVDVELTRCGALAVRARGDQGSVAALKRLPAPACLPE
jgi:hypothetical protein